MRDEVKAVGEVKIAAELCPKAIPVGDEITVSKQIPARAPPPQQGWGGGGGAPSGARNALVSMVSFTGHLGSMLSREAELTCPRSLSH